MNKRSLTKQLLKTGAKSHEAEDLTQLANSLSSIKTKGLSDTTKLKILDNIGEKPKILYPMRWAISAVAVATAAFALVFVTLPKQNQPVEINRETDTATLEVTEQQQAEEEMVLEQFEEVEQLKSENAEPDKIQEAENRYETSVEELWKKYGADKDDDKQVDYWDWWNRRRSQKYDSQEVNGWSDDNRYWRDNN